MHSITVGKTRFHFNQDMSGDVVIHTEGEMRPQVVIPYADLDAFIARSRAEKAKHISHAPKNPEAFAERQRTLELVKERVTALLQAEQKQWKEDGLMKKMFQVAINAVNGAR